MTTCSLQPDGTYVNNICAELVCYTSGHFIHLIVAIVVTLVFLVICLLVAINLYEVSETAEEHKGKENSNGDFYMIISKFTMTVLFSYFDV